MERNNRPIITVSESQLQEMITEAVLMRLTEAGDRSEYWKKRWEKQKAEGSVPDRSEYWKERAKKQKAERIQKKKAEKRKLSKADRRIKKAADDWEWHCMFNNAMDRDVLDMMDISDGYGDWYPGDND